MIMLHPSFAGFVPLFCDNKSALDLATALLIMLEVSTLSLIFTFSGRKFSLGVVNVLLIAYKLSPIDILIKGLGKVPHWSCPKLGLTFSDISPTSWEGDQDYNDHTSDIPQKEGLSRIILIWQELL